MSFLRKALIALVVVAGLLATAIMVSASVWPTINRVETGKTIEGLLASGDLSAAINVKADDPEIRSMIPDPTEAGIKAYKSRGHYPINHLVAVRDEVLKAHPEVAVSVFNAFAESKRLYLDKLKNGRIEKPSEMDLLYTRMLELTDDPLPYGIKPNLHVLDELIRHAHTQQILRNPVNLKDIFAPSTLDLIA